MKNNIVSIVVCFDTFFVYSFHYRHKEPVKRDRFRKMVMYGEMSTVPLDQLITLVDSVSLIAIV